jgi:hypothetical protein
LVPLSSQTARRPQQTNKEEKRKEVGGDDDNGRKTCAPTTATRGRECLDVEDEIALHEVTQRHRDSKTTQVSKGIRGERAVAVKHSMRREQEIALLMSRTISP